MKNSDQKKKKSHKETESSKRESYPVWAKYRWNDGPSQRKW